MKELVIKNVRQVHIERGGSETGIVLWIETTNYDNPLNDVRMQEKEE